MSRRVACLSQSTMNSDADMDVDMASASKGKEKAADLYSPSDNDTLPWYVPLVAYLARLYTILQGRKIPASHAQRCRLSQRHHHHKYAPSSSRLSNRSHLTAQSRDSSRRTDCRTCSSMAHPAPERHQPYWLSQDAYTVPSIKSRSSRCVCPCLVRMPRNALKP